MSDIIIALISIALSLSLALSASRKHAGCPAHFNLLVLYDIYNIFFIGIVNVSHKILHMRVVHLKIIKAHSKYIFHSLCSTNNNRIK